MSETDSPPLTVGRALAQAAETLRRAGRENERADAEVLLAVLLGCGREVFHREPERPLAAGLWRDYQAQIARRAAGIPLQHLTGVQEFWSIPFHVGPEVLIPRPETEFVVQAVLQRLPAAGGPPFPDRLPPHGKAGRPVPPLAVGEAGDPERPGAADRPRSLDRSRATGAPRILDLGTGSGCIAVALAAERPDARLIASEISPVALRLANENARRAGVAERVRFVLGHLFTPFHPARARWQLIASNPPYVSDAELAGLAVEVREHEPRQALLAGPRGNEVIEQIIVQARSFLAPGGWLVLEVGAGQKPEVERLAGEAGGWGGVEWVADLAGIPRVACLRAQEGRARGLE